MLAAREFDIHLHHQRAGIKPALAQHHAHGVRAAVEVRRDVVSNVQIALIKRRPARIQIVVPDLRAVDAQFVVTQPANVSAGAARSFRQVEFLPQLIGAANPLTFPLISGKQRHIETRGLAVVTGVPIFVPVPDFPPIGVVALQGFPVVNHLRRIVRSGLTTIPLVALILGQQLRAGSHQNLIGGLHLRPRRV